MQTNSTKTYSPFEHAAVPTDNGLPLSLNETLFYALELIQRDRGAGPFNPQSNTDQGCSLIHAIVEQLEGRA